MKKLLFSLLTTAILLFGIFIPTTAFANEITSQQEFEAECENIIRTKRFLYKRTNSDIPLQTSKIIQTIKNCGRFRLESATVLFNRLSITHNDTLPDVLLPPHAALDFLLCISLSHADILCRIDIPLVHSLD